MKKLAEQAEESDLKELKQPDNPHIPSNSVNWRLPKSKRLMMQAMKHRLMNI